MKKPELKLFHILMILVIVSLSLGLFPALAATPEPILVADINPVPLVGSLPTLPFLTPLNNTLLFVADNGLIGEELWMADQISVSLVKDIALGLDSVVPYNLKAHNGLLYFTGNDGFGTGEELWISDGTFTGTVQLKDINPTGDSNPSRFTSVGSTLYFQATNGVNGFELWKTDGTPTGTVMVKDINPNAASAYPTIMTDVNGVLFFVATDTDHGEELWKSDGTQNGTLLVKDIISGTEGSSILRLLSVDDKLFFRANDGIHGSELWISDGTITGTEMVKDIFPGFEDSSPTEFVTLNGKLYFRANDGSTGMELWNSDGTEAGTGIIKDINPGASGSSPSSLTTIGGVIYFAAFYPSTGREVWKSDGTGTGTQLVKEINPSGSSSPALFTAVNETVFFRASDDVNGNELWKTNGTAESTQLVKDINPGTNGSVPADFVQVQDLLYFTADDGVHGKELWALNLQNLAPTADAGGPYAGTEGSPIALTGNANDDDQVIVEWTSTDPGCEISNPAALGTTVTCTDNGDVSLILQVWDWWNLSATDQTIVSVSNAAPEIISLTLSASSVQIGAPVNVTVLYDDPGQEDTHTVIIVWDDGTSENMTVDPIARSAVSAHAYSDSGQYTIEVTVFDNDGASVEYTTDVNVEVSIQEGKIYIPLIEH